MQKPSVGRAVHYVSAGSSDGRFASTCRPAVVVIVHGTPDQQLNLFIMSPSGSHSQNDVPYDEAGAPYTWHWPERVD